MKFLDKLSLTARLYLGFGTIGVLVATAGALSIDMGRRAQQSMLSMQSNGIGVGALADAQSALWELRYGFPQFMLVDEAGRKKIVDAEPLLRSRIDEAFKRYVATDVAPVEAKALAELTGAFGKYMEARPKWFELQGAGKTDEAKAWRAATTTPLGAATVRGFADLITLQATVAQAEADAIKQGVQREQAVIAALLGLALVLGVSVCWWVVHTMRRSLAHAVALANRVAAGDLSEHPRSEGHDELAQLLQALGGMVESLRRVVGDVRQSSDSIAAGSAQIASGNADLSQRTEEQASKLQQTAASMEQLTSTVKQNSDTANEANQLASSASAAAAKGGVVVGQVVNTMEQIAASSKKIADIISVIDGIAFQTNILALNAAVEAARAGEQGRGFAVVAAEVRSLAQRSAHAAKEIKDLIGESVDKVQTGSKLVDDAGQSMAEIVQQVRRVTDLIAEISAASIEQTQGIGQVGAAVNQLDRVTQQNAALVEQSAAAADSLRQQAARLASVVGVFQLGGTAAPRQQHFAGAPSTPHAATRQALGAAKAARPRAAAPASSASASASAKTESQEWEQF